MVSTKSMQTISEKQKLFNEARIHNFVAALCHRFDVSMDDMMPYHKARLDKTEEDPLCNYVEENWAFLSKVKWSKEIKQVSAAFVLSLSQSDGIIDPEKWISSVEDNRTVKVTTNEYHSVFNTPSKKRKFFETIHNLGMLPELYFMAGRSKSLMPDTAQDEIMTWCEKKEIDLDQILQEYEVVDFNDPTALIYRDPEILERQEFFDKNPPLDVLNNLMRRSAFSQEELKVVTNSIDVALMGSVSLEDSAIAKLRAVKGASNNYTARRFMVLNELIIGSVESTVRARSFLNGQRDTKAIETNLDLHRDAFHSLMDNKKYRNEAFKLAGEYDLLPELYFMSNRPDSLLPKGTSAMLIAWARDVKNIDLHQSLLDYQLRDASLDLDHENDGPEAGSPANVEDRDDWVDPTHPDIDPELIKALVAHFWEKKNHVGDPAKIEDKRVQALKKIAADFGLDGDFLSVVIPKSSSSASTQLNAVAQGHRHINSSFDIIKNGHNNPNQDAFVLYVEYINQNIEAVVQTGVDANHNISGTLAQVKRKNKKFGPAKLGAVTQNSIFARFKAYGLLPVLKHMVSCNKDHKSILPTRDIKARLDRWEEREAQNEVKAIADVVEEVVAEDSLEVGVVEDKMPEPVVEDSCVVDFEKDLGTQFLDSLDGHDALYDDTKKRLIGGREAYYNFLATIDPAQPYEAFGNEHRDIPRTIVPELLPEGKRDADVTDLTGDFINGGKPRRFKPEVVIQRERRDLIVKAFKENPQIDQTSIREFTHPEFDTQEGRYYTVIHAETHDGNWTQAAVSIAEGQPAFFEKQRYIVDPETGQGTRCISDLRENLFTITTRYYEDKPQGYEDKAREVSSMSARDVMATTKNRIHWSAYLGRQDQVLNSLADHIEKNGTAINKNSGVIMTGDIHIDYDTEHPSLIYRTRWDRVFWALDEERIIGMEGVKTPKDLLTWAVDKNPELLDKLNYNVQEWLCSDDDELSAGTNSVITTAEAALSGGDAPANDSDDTVRVGDTILSRAQLYRALG